MTMAGDRYEELARRVKGGFGKLDAAGASDLMTRPCKKLTCAPWGDSLI